MIGFFRRIRRKMANENKFVQYSRYAIGEIVLVMVGILLALQVNNWSENIKRETLEISTLKELKENIQQDIEDMKVNLLYYKTSSQSARIIAEALENRTPYHDSLQQHFGKVSLTPLFLPTKSAYDNLQNGSGTQLISNDSLRKGLQKLYDVGYVLMIKVADLDQETSKQEIAKMYQKVMSEYASGVYALPVDYNSLFENQEFKNMITQQMNERDNHFIPLAEAIIQNQRDMLQRLDNELLIRKK